MIDAMGSGQMDLVLMQAGAQAIRILHNRGGGSFEELDTATMGLAAHGHAVACAVGDYDGDGLNDLAVALEDRVLLFTISVTGNSKTSRPNRHFCRATAHRALRLWIMTTMAIWIFF